MRPPTKQRHVTYKKREIPIYSPIEEQLMEEMGLTFSDLAKTGIKRLWNSRQNQKLMML